MATPMPEFQGKSTTQQKIDDAFPLDDDTQQGAPGMDPLSLGREEPELPNISVQRGGIRFPTLKFAADVPAPQIYSLLSRVMAEVSHVGKTGVNQQQGYNFRGIDAVVNALGPAMRKHGVVPVPKVKKVDYRETMTTGNKPTREVTVQVRYRFYAPDGSYVDAFVIGESLDQSDKGSAKAMSVAYRIALLQVFALPTDEPDPDAQYHTRDGVGAMAPSVAKLLADSLESDATEPDALAMLWPIVLEHSAAEREAYDNLTWANLFAAAFAKHVERVDDREEGIELWTTLKPIGFLNVTATLDGGDATLAAHLRARAAFLEERKTKTFDHSMEHVTAATTPEELDTALGCAHASLELGILDGAQFSALAEVAADRLPKLEREMNVAVEPSAVPELTEDADGAPFLPASGTDWQRFVDDCINYFSFEALMDLLTNGREHRAGPAAAWGEAGMVRVLDAIKRAHRKEQSITNDQRAELVQALLEHAEMSGIRIVEGTW